MYIPFPIKHSQFNPNSKDELVWHQAKWQLTVQQNDAGCGTGMNL